MFRSAESVCSDTQEWRGHLAVYYTSPQSFILTFPCSYSKQAFIELNVSTTTTGGVILCIIIGDVHQFKSHCLIPLDPWVIQLGKIFGYSTFRGNAP